MPPETSFRRLQSARNFHRSVPVLPSLLHLLDQVAAHVEIPAVQGHVCPEHRESLPGSRTPPACGYPVPPPSGNTPAPPPASAHPVPRRISADRLPPIARIPVQIRGRSGSPSSATQPRDRDSRACRNAAYIQAPSST